MDTITNDVGITTRPEPDLTGLFDYNAGWEFAETEICRHEKLFPNGLAFNQTRAMLCLIVKRSKVGGDCALSESGLGFLEGTLEKGSRKDGKPVRHVYLVYADVDSQARGKQWLLKVIGFETPQEARDRLVGIPPNEGSFGPYWWV